MRKLSKIHETSAVRHWASGRRYLQLLWKGKCTRGEHFVRRLFPDLKQSSVVLGNKETETVPRGTRWHEFSGHITIQAGVGIPQVCMGIILNLCLNHYEPNLYMCRVLLTIYNQNQNQMNQSRTEEHEVEVVSLIQSHDPLLRVHTWASVQI